MKECSYCGKKGQLAQLKTYCLICQKNMAKECIRCKRPHSNLKLFKENSTRCNSCQKKYEKEKEKNTTKKLRVFTN